jgi:uncharacterized membrane protein YdjX (TVP38/TMEM64 family)
MDKRKLIVIALCGLSALAGIVFLKTQVYADEGAWRETLGAFLTQARGTPWAFPLVVGSYLVAGLVFFPITLLNLICAIVFGYWGILYALVGAMANVTVFFFAGELVQRKGGGKKWLEHPTIAPVDKKLRRSGIAGVVFLHMLPAPPFTIMNFIAGLSSIPAITFLVGSLIALLPGAIARGIVGESLTQVLVAPTLETYLWLALGLVLWVAIIAGTHVAMKRFSEKDEDAEEKAMAA